MPFQEIIIIIDEILLRRVDRLISESRFPNRNRFFQEAVVEILEHEQPNRLARELAELDPIVEQKLANDDQNFSQEWLRD